MKENEIKVGDWVTVKKIGLTGVYEVESIDGDNYTVIQKEGTWISRLKLKKSEISK